MTDTKDTYHHGDLRNALIAAGLHILATEGAGELTLRKVARQAGVSHAAPYRHFADKGALLAAVAAEGFQRLSALVQQAIDAHAGQPRQLLPEAGWAYVRFALEHPDHLRVMFSNRIGDYAAYPGLLDTAMDALGRLTQAITRAQAAGHVAPGDPFRLTLSTWAMLHGIATLMIEQKLPGMDCSDPAAMEPVARQMLGVYFNGLQQGLPEVTP